MNSQWNTGYLSTILQPKKYVLLFNGFKKRILIQINVNNFKVCVLTLHNQNFFENIFFTKKFQFEFFRFNVGYNFISYRSCLWYWKCLKFKLRYYWHKFFFATQIIIQFIIFFIYLIKRNIFFFYLQTIEE